MPSFLASVNGMDFGAYYWTKVFWVVASWDSDIFKFNECLLPCLPLAYQFLRECVTDATLKNYL